MPFLVQFWRINGDAQLPVNDAEDSSAHAALRRHAHAVGPLSRMVVQAARKHYRQHVFNVLVIEDSLARNRICAHICEGPRHHARSWQFTRSEHCEKYW